MNKFHAILLVIALFFTVEAYASIENLENKFIPVEKKITTMSEESSVKIEVKDVIGLNMSLSSVQPVELMSQILPKPAKKELETIDLNMPKVNVKPANSSVVENVSVLPLNKVRIEDKNSLVFQARDTLLKQKKELEKQIELASI